MRSLIFDITCPDCGYPVSQVSGCGGSPRQRAMVVRCTNGAGGRCGLQFIVSVDLAYADVTEAGDPGRCGTTTGYKNHRLQGTPICEPCNAAHRFDVADRDARSRELATA